MLAPYSAFPVTCVAVEWRPIPRSLVPWETAINRKTPERAAKEKLPEFKKGQKFRAGIEGTISGLLRGRGMRRCMDEGQERFEVFVGAAILAYNLLVIAELVAARKSRRRKRA